MGLEVMSLGAGLLLSFVAAAQAQSDWQSEWEKTLAAAEKEGEVALYGAYRSGVREAVSEFTKRYPKIRFNHVAGSGSELANKVMAEKRANRHFIDIAVGGGGTMVLVYHKGGLLEPMQSAFLLPEVKDPSHWWGKKHHYADPDGSTVLMAQGDVNTRIGAFNTKLVKPDEIQSWWDLLNPKWKGKIVMTDPRSRGNIGNWRYIYYNPELGPDFVRRLLSETEVTFSSNERQMMDWLASGKHAIYVMAKDEDVAQAMKQGLSVDFLESHKEMAELGTGSGHIAFFKNAPSQRGKSLHQLVPFAGRPNRMAEIHRRQFFPHRYTEGDAAQRKGPGAQGRSKVSFHQSSSVRKHQAAAAADQRAFRGRSEMRRRWQS